MGKMSVLMFLTQSEIFELTGCVQHAAQKRWLAKNGLRFFVRRDGAPSVPKEQVFTEQPSGPDLAALDRLG